MSQQSINQFIRTYFLAICCVVVPIVMGFLLTEFAERLVVQEMQTFPAHYEFVSSDATASRSSATAQHGAAPSTTNEKLTDDERKISLFARDLLGRTEYAMASAALWLTSTLCGIYGLYFIRKRLGVAATLLSLLIFPYIGWKVAINSFDILRPLVVENVLVAAPTKGLAGNGKSSSFLLDWLFSQGEGFCYPLVTNLERFNTLIGFSAVCLLLMATASVSIRSQSIREYSDLRDRRELMERLLYAGVAVLVIAVLESQALISWPTSLLAEGQQKAIAPIGDALMLMFGVAGTMTLVSVAIPALVAFELDRRDFLTTIAAGGLEGDANGSIDLNGLSFSTWPSIRAALGFAAPLLAASMNWIIKATFS